MSLPEPGDGYTFGNCTYGMALLYPDLPSNLGNADTWVPKAQADGLTVVSRPIPGSIVGYSGGDKYSSFGHVAKVESLNSDGTFVVREMNFTAFNGWDTRTSNMTDVMGFIIPPGANIDPSSLQLLSTGSSTCRSFTWSLFGTSICFDGLVGSGAIALGALVMAFGVFVLIRGSMTQPSTSTSKLVEKQTRKEVRRKPMSTATESNARRATARSRASSVPTPIRKPRVVTPTPEVQNAS